MTRIETVDWCVKNRWVDDVVSDPRFPPSGYYKVFYLIMRELKPDVAVELGTCGGGASLHMALGNPNTEVFTFDIAREPSVVVAEEMASNFHFYREDSVLASERFWNPEVEFLFIDTTHTYEQTMREYEAWLPKMDKKGIIAMDDVGREGMWKAIAEIGGVQRHYVEIGGNDIPGVPGGMVFVFLGG